MLKDRKDTGQNRAAHASAPRDSPPPSSGSKQTIASDIRRDVVRSRTIVSEVQRDVTDTHAMVTDIHRTFVTSPKERIEGRSRLAQETISGESPPPPPRACFGRDELIAKIIDLAENLTPIALIGPGGIGKTSIALTVLHNDRIKQRFGGTRRFIRCDEFPASFAYFLRRLSEVIGAGIKNPENLNSLRSSLSSVEMVIILDNAESILDPRGVDAEKIYDVVEELSHFSNICLCITSRISTIPTDCKTIEIPTLWIGPARDTFYRIYQHGEPSDLVDDILEQLDFHPLSITLLATVAHHNKWRTGQLSEEWGRRRTSVLKTEHNKSLAATIELSLASPMFQQLGSDARELLGVVAFFPQGVDESNLDWLFPTVSNRSNIFNGFCVLSLTHRSGRFVTMLAPLRDYLSPKDPISSPLLCTTKRCYFARMSARVSPNSPGFEDTRWIKSEDVNVEYLLDVFASIDPNSDNAWEACINFMRHMFWHKQRLVVLRPKIEALPDDHHSKPDCLLELSQLFRSVGHHTANKEVLTQASNLWRKREGGYRTAETLMYLAFTNRALSLYQEGISQARESLKICERLNHKLGQAHSLRCLAWMLRDDNQLDAAKTAASRAIDIFTEIRVDGYGLCQSHRALGVICHSKGEMEEAIGHFEIALGMASASNWPKELFWNHYCMAELFFDEGRFDNAHSRVERAKSHTADDLYLEGRGMQLEATFFHKQGRLGEAQAEALGAVEVFEKVGNTLELEKCRGLLRDIRRGLDEPVVIHGLGSDGLGHQ
ncbi:hypothetical protein BJ322DRAFT_712430 [Thelephora terrestris]|uniref:AAA+ ATPase domain-containing protein n=1 Tax=Thelephora terrestris TaxID=56493 RepID=A0A9P6HI92_9AGAM|nr:hypothetical protein BJ322DRAFT_712430 [Thelephora terrestris]